MSKNRSKGIVVSAFVLLLFSAGLNVLQAQRIRNLLEFKSPSPVLGTRASTIEGFSQAGYKRELVLAGDTPTLLYYFSERCGWCERNWENLRAVSSGANGRYRVVLLTKDRNISNYLTTRGLHGIETIEGIGEGTMRSLGLGATPHTIVVSRDAVITHEWRGAYTARIARQLEGLLGIELPGVSPATR